MTERLTATRLSKGKDLALVAALNSRLASSFNTPHIDASGKQGLFVALLYLPDDESIGVKND